MNHHLSFRNILALGFMTFALFVGAGNIIFPPMVGLQSGENFWVAACGFLITSVGLPLITLIAIARVGGNIDALSAPVGREAGLLLATICYLVVGPLFAIPRTATVSFEVGIVPLISEVGTASLASGDASALLIYSLIYFVLVVAIAFYPHRLLDTVGHILAPLKMLSLAILGVAAIFWPAGAFVPANDTYMRMPFSTGFVSGYLTMDTFAAMVFGIVIVNAARTRGVQSAVLLTRYTIWAGLIAGAGLTLVYLSLFKLGSGSGVLVANTEENGAAILRAYVQHSFGGIGSFFLAALIFIACMVTAIGLTCACAEFFSRYLRYSYRTVVLIIALFSMLVSNLGLDHLIKISLPVLTAIHPPCILLVILSFTTGFWNKSVRIFAPVMLVSLLFGVLDGLKASVFSHLLPTWVGYLPLAEQQLAWLLPSSIVMMVAAFYDKIYCGPRLGHRGKSGGC